MNLSSDFEELFASLTAHRVKALIAGAYAVAFHARPRFTKDLDLFVEPSPTNATRLIAWKGRGAGLYGAAKVFYLGKRELIRNKAAAGRPQDQLDLVALREPETD